MTVGRSGQRATITDVARHLGVSKSTVSRAFTRPGVLLPSTVERVREAAAVLGYSPSRTAMALSTGVRSMIGVVVPDISNPFFPRLIRAAQARAGSHGMTCVLSDSDETAGRELDLVRELAPDVHGFLLVSSRLPDAKLRELAETTNLVLVNRDVEGVRRVLLDTRDGLRRALALLFELGHRRFAYIGGPDASWSHAQRLAVATAFAAERPVSLTIEQAVPATFQGGADAALRALDERPSADRPTAFLCFDDTVAQGVTAALARTGLRVPDDVSVVGCDDTLGSVVYPPMATIRLDYAAAAFAAVDLLLSGGPGVPGPAPASVARTLLPGRFLEGATIAGPPAAAMSTGFDPYETPSAS